MGGNDIENEGEYVWNNLNIFLIFINWYNFELSFYDLNGVIFCDCIDLLRNGEWNYRFCFYL